MVKNENYLKNKETKYIFSFIMINQNYLTLKLTHNINFKKKNKNKILLTFKIRIWKKIDKTVIY